ncbi:hypothetical protein [Pseudoalteromonas umbrosa]|uniref:hypothetical protein n=1 Tax=Pseudoalteromonas umbrosa TaxID=3048489 RepID=UPI0024C2F124|nr:hypothetical protein [Pseudoalteromonas sp. B95]MDK1289772.1 hypothetical protein [Pseudoalteromonas sp. B95]
MVSNSIFNFVGESKSGNCWKEAISTLFDRGNVVVPQTQISDAIYETIKADVLLVQLVVEEPLSFLKACNIDVKKTNCERAYLSSVYHHIHVVMDRAASLELVNIEEKSPKDIKDDTYLAYKYTLTSKGLETVLKLQEHEDNKRRHEASLSQSRKAFVVSVLALITVIVSTIFSYYRLSFYENQVLSPSSEQVKLKSKLSAQKEN